MIERAISLVLPAFNEERRLPASLDQLEEWYGDRRDVEVIVVDDGSTDDTAELVGKRAIEHPALPLRLIRQSMNLGKGAALATGFAAAEHPYVFFIDADLPVPHTTLTSMLLLADDAVLVVGSRRLAGAAITTSQPIGRRLGGWGFRTLASAIGFELGSDPQCGVKLLHRDAMAPIVDACTSPRFAFDIELITRTQTAGYRWVECPVSWRHVEGSSLRPARDAISTLQDLAELRRRLRR